MKGHWDWTEIDSANEGLPAGAYVVKIVAVNDGKQTQTGAETLEVVYDIAEGEHAGHYSDEWGKNNTWSHTDRRYYGTAKTNGMFKGWLEVLQSSNPMFSADTFGNTNSELVGLIYGIGLQKRLYTNDKGEDKEALEVVRTWPVQKVRAGECELPEPRDMRKDKSGISYLAPNSPVIDTSGEIYDDQIPF